MKGICRFLLILILISLLPAGLAYEGELLFLSADSFYYDRFEDAIAFTESDILEIGYRVCKLPAEAQVSDYDHYIQYNLIFTNKTGETISDLHFDAHFKNEVQFALRMPKWYNEPMDVKAANESGTGNSSIYAWTPLVSLESLIMLDDIPYTDFYDMLIEISWKGGSEIVRLDYESALIPEPINQSLNAYAPLDEAELCWMREKGRAIGNGGEEHNTAQCGEKSK